MTRVAVVVAILLVAFAWRPIEAPAAQRQRTMEGLVTLPSTAGSKDRGSVEGVVLALETGEPIANATVALSRVGRMAELVAMLENQPPPGPIEPLTTDGMGRFTFRDLDAGSYKLDVTKDGYTLLQPEPAPEYTGADAPIKLKYGADQRNVEIRLARFGGIHGHVRDFEGKPAAGVPVQALRQTSTSGERRWQIIEETRSDKNGEYRLDAVVPGSCIVAAGAAIARTSLFETLNSADGEYGYAFYPGTSSADTAATLVVKGGERLTADFTLNPERRYRIRGRVVFAIDKSWPVSIAATLSSVAPTGIARRASAAESALIHYEPRDGSFEVSDLLPGAYTISMTARRPSNDDISQPSGTVTVVVEDSDIEGVGVTLELIVYK